MNDIKSMIYGLNKTLKMLGKQSLLDFFYDDEVRDVWKGYMGDAKKGERYKVCFYNFVDVLIDIYNLGVIHGVRKERERRKKRPVNTGNVGGCREFMAMEVNDGR